MAILGTWNHNIGHLFRPLQCGMKELPRCGADGSWSDSRAQAGVECTKGLRDHINMKIPQFGSKAKTREIPETMLCRILMLGGLRSPFMYFGHCLACILCSEGQSVQNLSVSQLRLGEVYLWLKAQVNSCTGSTEHLCKKRSVT